MRWRPDSVRVAHNRHLIARLDRIARPPHVEVFKHRRCRPHSVPHFCTLPTASLTSKVELKVWIDEIKLRDGAANCDCLVDVIGNRGSVVPKTSCGQQNAASCPQQSSHNYVLISGRTIPDVLAYVSDTVKSNTETVKICKRPGLMGVLKLHLRSSFYKSLHILR